MKSLLFSLSKHPLTEKLSESLNLPIGNIASHTFPDKESYIRIHSSVKNKKILLIESLNHPNEKLLPLIFFANAAKDLGAHSVSLIAPYLGYLRQDKRFHEGEAITSKSFAKILSNHFDNLLTIDPHLHRYHSLDEIYSIPSQVLHTMPTLANWIEANVSMPLLIGPDRESEQWINNLASIIEAPSFVLDKTRLDDKTVTIKLPELENYRNHQPIIMDDIISTGHTMIEAARQLISAKMHAPICLAVHAVFADNAYSEMLASDIKEIVTCNTIPHASNQIDVSDLITQALQDTLLK